MHCGLRPSLHRFPKPGLQSGQRSRRSRKSDAGFRISTRQSGLGTNAARMQKKRSTIIRRKLKRRKHRLQRLPTRSRDTRCVCSPGKRVRRKRKKRSDRAELDAREQERRAKLLEDLEKNMEGFQQSVKTVMRESFARCAARNPRAGFQASHRSVRICGGALKRRSARQCRTLSSTQKQDAKRAIALLKGSETAAVPTFLPLSVIRGKTLAGTRAGRIARVLSEWPIALCSCEEQIPRGSCDSLLGQDRGCGRS